MGLFTGPVGKLIKASGGPKPRKSWEPLYPSIVDPRSDLELDELNDSGKEWEPAPPESHVLEFRFYDGRKEKKFWRDTALAGGSQIHIRFKPSGKRGVTEYKYQFYDMEQAAKVYDMLKQAQHPGQIVHHILIAGGIHYDRMA